MSRTAHDAPKSGTISLGALVCRLVPSSGTRALQTSSALFRQGDPVREVFVVERGRLRLQRHTVEGVRLTLQMAREGDLLAEPSMFAQRYHCEAVADTAGVVRVFDRGVILDAIESRPDLARSVMAVLAGQVIDLRTRLELRNVRSARERIWQHLSLAADSRRQIKVAAPLKELAEALGLTPEAFYRELAHLEREGLICRDPGMIRIMRRRIADVRHSSP